MHDFQHLQEIENDQITTRIHRSLHSAIGLIYSDLKNKQAAHQTFLLCCLLGHNATIQDLLKYGVGLELFSAVKTIKESRDEALASVSKFRDSSLLFNGVSNMHFYTHALVQDFAVAIASKDFGVLALKEGSPYGWSNRDAMEKFKWIYISHGNIDGLRDELECPQLTFFHLSDKNPSSQIPSNFFRQTTKLRVLGLTEMYFSTIPSSIRLLKDLHTLRLDQCVFGVADIGAVIGELVKLHVLSLAGCDINELPKETGKLTDLKLLDLSDCCKLKVIQPGVLSSLAKLEELYMGNSFDQWEDVEEHANKKNACAAELLRLKLLTAVEVCIKFCNTQMILKDLFSGKLGRYKVFVGDVWNYWDCSLESSNVLKLKLDARIDFDDSVKRLLKKTNELHLESLNRVKNVIHELDDEGFQNLKFLLVQDAPNIQHFVNSGSTDPCKAFPILEVLILRKLKNMEKICHVPVLEASFSKLRKIAVENCDRLKNLFSISIARHLFHLQEITVKSCDEIQEIVGGEEHEVRNDTAETTEVAKPHELLRSLRLQRLPALVCFNSSSRDMTLFNEQVDFPRLEELHLSWVSFSTIWRSRTTSYSIQNLTKLIIEGCNALEYAFSLSLAEVLVKLRHLEINECKKMTEIISTQNELGNEISFPQLNFLQIKELENLTRFCSNTCWIAFPSLKTLALEYCQKLKGFSVKLTSTDVKESIQPLFNEQVAFPRLERLVIECMGSLNKIRDSQLDAHSFCRLNDLKVDSCGKILNIFPSSMLARLERLNTLYVWDCGSLEEIIESQTHVALPQPDQFARLPTFVEIPAKIVFPNLVNLNLYMLPRLKANSLQVHNIEFPSLNWM